MCAPEPIYHSTNQMNMAAELPCSLKAVFFVYFKNIQKNSLNNKNIIFVVHEKEKTYSMSKNAEVCFEKYFDENRKLLEENSNSTKDSFIR